MSLSKITVSISFCTAAFTAPLNAASLEPLITQVGAVESGWKADAVGDGGRALGCLQIHAGVVLDVNRHFSTQFTHREMLDPAMATRVFRLYMAIYATEKRLGRPVRDIDRALIWHLGPNGWKRSYTEAAKRYLSKFNPPLK